MTTINPTKKIALPLDVAQQAKIVRLFCLWQGEARRD
jgi:hypothetical protein